MTRDYSLINKRLQRRNPKSWDGGTREHMPKFTWARFYQPADAHVPGRLYYSFFFRDSRGYPAEYRFWFDELFLTDPTIHGIFGKKLRSYLTSARRQFSLIATVDANSAKTS